jgi:hypothetical protein
MNIEKGKISGRQYSLLIMGFIEGSIILTSYASYASNIVKNSTWLVILSASAFWFGRIAA